MASKRILWALLLAASASACNTVEFYEKAAFSNPVMDLGTNATLGPAEQKVVYSTEGAAGGLGTSAGGGCGCY